MGNKATKLGNWKRAFNKHYAILSKKNNHKDAIGSITSKKGQSLSKQATTLTNKQMGYTEMSAVKVTKKKPKAKTRKVRSY